MNKIIIRLLLSPIISVWAIFMLAAGTLFLFPLIVLFHFYYLIGQPFIWLLRKSGSKIEYPDPLYLVADSKCLSYFVYTTLYIWFPFWVIYIYIKDGTIFTGD